MATNSMTTSMSKQTDGSEVCISTCRNHTDESVNNPLLWMLVKQNDRLENKMMNLQQCETCKKEANRCDGRVTTQSQDIKDLQLEVKRLKEKVEDINKHQSVFVGFHALITTSPTYGPSEKVVFDKVLYNHGNAYNKGSGIFKAPIKGEYFFTATYLGLGTSLHLQLIKNNEEIGKAHASAPSAETGSMSSVVHLDVGDMVHVRHLPGSPKQTIHGGWSYFTGFLLRQIN